MCIHMNPNHLYTNKKKFSYIYHIRVHITKIGSIYFNMPSSDVL